MGSRPTAAGARAGGRGAVPRARARIHREMSICGFSFFLLSAPRRRGCAELWESRAVDGGRDFQRLWEGPGAGGRWPGAFHIRSASTAWVGESFACPGGPSRPAVRACVAACGLACRPACGSAEPRAELRAALREPRADLRAALRGRDSAAPTPLRPLRISSLADGGIWESGTKSLTRKVPCRTEAE